MRELRVTFNVATSYITPFQADTIFGHLCWAMNYLDGEEQLVKFLNAYTDDYAPLLVSDAFPADLKLNRYFLPKPDLPPTRILDQNAEVPADVNKSAIIKKVKKIAYIPETELLEKRDSLDTAYITDCCRQLLEHGGHVRQESVSVTHNILDRLTNASNNVFVTDEVFPSTGFHFLVRFDNAAISADAIERYIDYIASTGYGSNSSTGKGALRGVSLDDSGIDPRPDLDWFLNLSSAYVPKQGQLGDGYYSVHVKRGKVGVGYAHEVKSVWKRPVLMIKAGAVLKGSSTGLYGRLVKNVHYEKPEIVQYGYAYPLGVKVNAADF